MQKKNETEATEAVETAVREFFYPPQDGRDAFVCEAKSQQEADAMYAAAANK